MRKYRIIQTNNHFYPQEKRWVWWEFLDNLTPKFTWDKDRKYHSMCYSKEDAEKVIAKRIKYLTRIKIIHKY